MPKLHHLSLACALSAALSIFGCAQGNVVLTGGAAGTAAGGTDLGGSSGAAGATGGTAGTAGTTGTAGTGATTTSTTAGGCITAEDCASFSDACNNGACINGACGKIPSMDGGPCDDGKMCTQNDTCLQGVCKPGPLKNCQTMGPCTVGMCDVVTDTCVQMPGNNGGFCNLGDPCVTLAACSNGACQPTQFKDCSFLNSVCGIGFCDPQLGCQAMAQNDGTPCNDSLFCTVQDQCISGQCKGVPNFCGVQGGDPCKTGTCNEGLKQCQVVAGNDGAACDDGNLCTTGETCSAGKCLGGGPANNGAACDDSNGCTGGTSCSNGVCANPQSQIVACVDGDMCCPAGCANDKDCLWYVSGVQQSIQVSQLTGWTQCFTDLYDDFNTPMSQILNQCSKGKLLMACRQVGSQTLHTLAMGPRPDVLFDCAQQSNCTHESNGVAWYYSDSYSWGFAPAGETVSRNSCDTMNTQNEDRLCWHSGGGNINGGWRCGANTNLNGDPSWERLVYQAD